MVKPLTKLFKSFITNGPINILRQFASEIWTIQILWIFTYIVSISLFIYYVFGIFVKWQYDPDITINIRTVSYHEVPFPAITYCSPYVISDEAANFTDFHMKLYLNEKLKEFSEEEQNLLSTMVEICTPNIHQSTDMLMKRTEQSIIKLINKTRSSFELLYGYCTVESFNYYCDQMFNIVPTDRGLCYSFNMQGYNTIFNKGVLSSDFDFYKRKKIVKALDVNSPFYNQTVDDENETVHWTLQDGYLTNIVNSIPYRSSKRMISMYLGHKNDTYFKCYGSNFYLTLHLPNEVPTLSKNEAFVKLSSSTQILYDVKLIRHNINMKKYTPETRRCFFDGEKQLKFFKSYTTAHCNLECLTNYTVRMCGCALFYMPRIPKTQICELHNIACASDAQRNINVYKVKTDKYNIPCNCLPPCNDIKYTVKNVVTKPVTESNPIIIIMRKYNYLDPTIIEIGVLSTEFEEQEHFVAYGLQNFIADVGGLLGLFMGYSFLSIAKFIQNCIKYFREYKNSRRNVAVVVMDPRNIV